MYEKDSIAIMAQVALKAGVEVVNGCADMTPAEKPVAVTEYADHFMQWLVNTVAVHRVEDSLGNADRPEPGSQPAQTHGNASGDGSVPVGNWKFPFGKHKDVALKHIPKDYLRWYLANGEKEDVLNKIREYLGE